MKKHKLDVTLNEIKRMEKLSGLNESAKKPLKEGFYSKMTDVDNEFLNVEKIAKMAESDAELFYEDIVSSAEGDMED